MKLVNRLPFVRVVQGCFILFCFVATGSVAGVKESTAVKIAGTNKNEVCEALVEPECKPCGPTFCVSPTHAKAAREKKIVSLKAEGFPERLLELVNLNSDCAASSERGPDSFTLIVVEKNGDHRSETWTKEAFSLTKESLDNGEI